MWQAPAGGHKVDRPCQALQLGHECTGGKGGRFLPGGLLQPFPVPGAGEGGCRTRGERSVGWAGAELEYLMAREGKIVIKFRIKAPTPILNVRTMAEISKATPRTQAPDNSSRGSLHRHSWGHAGSMGLGM